jgi:uncharacterized protein (TIRG00374 family)
VTARARRMLTGAIKFAAAAGVAAYVVLSGRLDIERVALGADWAYIAAGFGVLLALPIVGWIRWWVVARALGVEMGLREAFRIHMIGVFFNSFLFGATGGDLLKAYYVAAEHGREAKATAVMTVVLDRVFGVVGLFVLLAAALPVAWAHVPSEGGVLTMGIAALAIYGGGMAFFLFLAIPRFREGRRAYLAARSAGTGLGAKVARVVDEMDEAIQTASAHPAMAAFCVAVSALGHLVSVVSFHLFAVALGAGQLPFGKHMVLAPIALGVNGLPILPAGGLGAGEFFSSLAFGVGAGVEKWVGGTVLFLWRISLFVPGLVGLAFFVRERPALAPVVPGGR